MLDLFALRAFVRTAETGSLTAAARLTGMTTSGVGKAVTRLEGHLGVRLLIRTTRRVRLTDEGLGFFDRCRAILIDLEEAEDAVTQGRAEPRGRLLVDAPLVIARRWIMPRLPDFLDRYPDLSLALTLEDKRVDLAQDGVDVAIRIGEQPDSAVVARRLANTERVTCGAAAYFARYGRPESPENLGAHNCLAHVLGPGERPQEWMFSHGGEVRAVHVAGNFCASRGQVLVDAAVGGVGLVQLPRYFVDEALDTGQLVPCLNGFAAPGPPISILYLRSRHLSPKVRAFVDFAITAVSGTRPGSTGSGEPRG